MSVIGRAIRKSDRRAAPIAMMLTAMRAVIVASRAKSEASFQMLMGLSRQNLVRGNQRIDGLGRRIRRRIIRAVLSAIASSTLEAARRLTNSLPPSRNRRQPLKAPRRRALSRERPLSNHKRRRPPAAPRSRTEVVRMLFGHRPRFGTEKNDIFRRTSPKLRSISPMRSVRSSRFASCVPPLS